MNYIYIIGATSLSPTARNDHTKYVTVPVTSWNKHLSPWPAPGLKAGEPFTGMAGVQIEKLKSMIASSESTDPASQRAILGYSMAGLFSLYAALETGLFSCAASVSGSLWYDGWDEYLTKVTIPPSLRFVFLSLGDREANGGPARLRTVERKTLWTREYFESRRIKTFFTFNPGGHFQDPEGRMNNALLHMIDLMDQE